MEIGKDTDKDATPAASPDPVNHPKHYCKGGLECIDVIKAAVSNLSGFEGYTIGNVLKYCWRWKSKGGIEDLRKAQKYLEFLIDTNLKQEKETENQPEMPTKKVKRS